MKFFKLFTLMTLVLFSFSCSKEKVKQSVINEKNLDAQVLEAYEEGMSSLEQGDVLFASKKFNEAEMLYPQSCLLYTSPSPRDAHESRMPSSA